MTGKGDSCFRRNLLVVTADDFGLDASINAAVEAADGSGILTAASLMVNGPAAQEAIRLARALPALNIGLHLALVDGRPTLSPKEIPDLVDVDGRLRSDLLPLSLGIACYSHIRAQLRAEIIAQFRAFQATGLALDHVNGHRHFHLHPLVAREVIAIGRVFGMTGIRVPAEPVRYLARVEAGPSGIPWLEPWIALLRRAARQSALCFPDAVFGRSWSGAFTKARLLKLLDCLPNGFVEIYLHPALTNAFSGHAAGYQYREEFAALCDQSVMAAAERAGRRGGYRDAR